jgi:hypothetical protein
VLRGTRKKDVPPRGDCGQHRSDLPLPTHEVTLEAITRAAMLPHSITLADDLALPLLRWSATYMSV